MGEHISDYAKSLLKENKEVFNKRFSKLLKEGFKPEKYSEHFEEMRKKILESYRVN